MKKVILLLFAFAALNINAIAQFNAAPKKEQQKPRISAMVPIPANGSREPMYYSASGSAMPIFLGCTFIVLATWLIINIIKVSK
jgi:hypothetical protein